MRTFYFTFGSHEDYPYQGGWVEVIAIDIIDAQSKFKERFPNLYPNTLNCASYYTENEFASTGMNETGNRGAMCHEVIE